MQNSSTTKPDYKSQTTVTTNVGFAKVRGFTFISSVSPWSISDKEIRVKSGLLNCQI